MCTDKRKKNNIYKKPICINTSDNIILPRTAASDSSSDSSFTLPISDEIPKKEIYIYYESEKMPDNGWMQSCFKCELFTAKTLIYREQEDRTYIVYVCNNCKKTLTKRENNVKFRERCDKFIKKYLED